MLRRRLLNNTSLTSEDIKSRIRKSAKAREEAEKKASALEAELLEPILKERSKARLEQVNQIYREELAEEKKREAKKKTDADLELAKYLTDNPDIAKKLVAEEYRKEKLKEKLKDAEAEEKAMEVAKRKKARFLKDLAIPLASEFLPPPEEGQVDDREDVIDFNLNKIANLRGNKREQYIKRLIKQETAIENEGKEERIFDSTQTGRRSRRNDELLLGIRPNRQAEQARLFSNRLAGIPAGEGDNDFEKVIREQGLVKPRKDELADKVKELEERRNIREREEEERVLQEGLRNAELAREDAMVSAENKRLAKSLKKSLKAQRKESAIAKARAVEREYKLARAEAIDAERAVETEEAPPARIGKLEKTKQKATDAEAFRLAQELEAIKQERAEKAKQIREEKKAKKQAETAELKRQVSRGIAVMREPETIAESEERIASYKRAEEEAKAKATQAEKKAKLAEKQAKKAEKQTKMVEKKALKLAELPPTPFFRATRVGARSTQV